jgi:hypothetical protein
MARAGLYVGQIVVLVALFAQTYSIRAEEPNYRRVEVGNRVSLDVPSHWHLRGLDDRRNVAAAAEAVVAAAGRPNEPVHVAALSVVSTPEPIGGIIRVSFISIEQLSQPDLANALRTDRLATMREVASVFHEDMLALSKGFESQGIHVLGQESVGTASIGGATAFTLSYRRTSAAGQSPFTVVQYHVPLGKQKALISLSYRESDAPLFKAIFDRVKRSIVIR